MIEKCFNYGVRLWWILLSFHSHGGNITILMTHFCFSQVHISIKFVRPSIASFLINLSKLIVFPLSDPYTKEFFPSLSLNKLYHQ